MMVHWSSWPKQLRVFWNWNRSRLMLSSKKKKKKKKSEQCFWSSVYMPKVGLMALGGILNGDTIVPLNILPYLGSWHIICPCCGQQEDLQHVAHTSSQIQLHKQGSSASYDLVIRWNSVPALKEIDLSGHPILILISSVTALYIQPLLHPI